MCGDVGIDGPPRSKEAGGTLTVCANVVKLQPDEHDRNYGTYAINHPLPIESIVDDFADPRP